MNWYLNHYFGEGKGIDKHAPKPRGFRLLAFVLGREWWELIKLNLLVFAFALPLVTLPAALFAAFTIAIMMIEDRNIYLLRDFWQAFRSRFWLVTGLGLAFTGMAVLAALAVRTYATAATDNLMFSAPLTIAVSVLVALPLYAAHLLVALIQKRNHAFGEAAKAAALGLLARPLPGLYALFVVAMLWIAHIAFYPASVFMPVLVNFSLSALVIGFAVREGVQFGFSQLAPNSGKANSGSPDTLSA